MILSTFTYFKQYSMKKPISEYKKGKMISVNDKMQKGYKYKLSEDYGKNLHEFFKPQLSPKQILEYGAFEGKYMNDCRNEFPKEWFTNAKLSPSKPDISKNYFKIKSRQSLKVWKQKRWIYGKDVRGWFQWYCRYYIGRRDPEVDMIQIKRHRAFKRHLGQIKKNCKRGDLSCRPRQRQALLQWGYNPFI